MAQRALFVSKLESDNGTIEVDSCLEETHQLVNTITDHPVEEGFNVTDHSRPEPDRVSLRCFVSNTPLSREQVERAIRHGNVDATTSAEQQSNQILGIDGRGQETFNQLERMRINGELLKVVTTLRTYAKSDSEGMMIESLSIPRTRQSYDGLEFVANLKRVRIVKNRSTTQKNTDKRTRKKKKQGQKLVDKDHGPEPRKVTAAKQAARVGGYGR